MEIVVIGLNHRTASVELRDRMAFSHEQACEASEQIRSHGVAKEIVILSTCNRTELYGVPNGHGGNSAEMMEKCFVSYQKLQLEDVRGAFYRRLDRDAVRHIYRVASGLDSMLLGEAEILGQVRTAYQNAFDRGVTGRVLNRLFQSALEVGKRVRTETGIGTHPMSVAFAGVKLAEGTLSSLRGRRALILGAGATSEKVIRHLSDRGVGQIRLLNRTIERARSLAARYAVEVVSWDELQTALEWPDLVVTSVACAEPVLTRDLLQQALASRGTRTLVLIDLGIPRNVAPSVADLGNVCLYNIDHLNEIVEQNRKAREKEIPRAETIVEAQVEDFARWQAGITACSVLKDLRTGSPLDREAFLRKHAEAMSHFSEVERIYAMELLKKFLSGSMTDLSTCSHEESEMWSRLEELGSRCKALDDSDQKR